MYLKYRWRGDEFIRFVNLYICIFFMMNIIEQLNRVSVNEVESKTDDKLIIRSTPRKIMNPLFIIGAIGFITSSLLRGFLNWHIGEIFLFIFTVILICGVWHLSAAGKFIINKTEGKIFRVYRHLGYLQKVYSYPIHSIDDVLLETESGNNLILLLKDDRTKIWLSQEKANLNNLQLIIGQFLAIKQKTVNEN